MSGVRLRPPSGQLLVPARPSLGAAARSVVLPLCRAPSRGPADAMRISVRHCPQAPSAFANTTQVGWDRSRSKCVSPSPSASSSAKAIELTSMETRAGCLQKTPVPPPGSLRSDARGAFNPPSRRIRTLATPWRAICTRRIARNHDPIRAAPSGRRGATMTFGMARPTADRQDPMRAPRSRPCRSTSGVSSTSRPAIPRLSVACNDLIVSSLQWDIPNSRFRTCRR